MPIVETIVVVGFVALIVLCIIGAVFAGASETRGDNCGRNY